MEQIKQAQAFAKEFIGKHPQHKEEVEDFLQLMIDEIEQGESPDNELRLFEGACEDLLTEE
jgi:hypothetical protein